MKRTILNLLLLLFLTACGSQKEVNYLQDIDGFYRSKIEQVPSTTIRPGDLVSIIVNSKDPELAQMFNLPVVSNTIISNNNYSGSSNRVSGYQVDRSGFIDFPQLGELKVAGLTLLQLSSLIKEQLIEEGYIKDPVVNSNYLNFKISVLGEVNHPGSFNLHTDRLTLFEALSMAGDLTIFGKRDNVKIIREVGSERSVVTVDLRSKELFNSNYYYLQQNDVVYVEPNSAKAGQREINQNRTTSTYVSIISLLITIAILIYK
ncbi:MAG: polysaccharide biosynthesis/export family protein [Phocaeicola sp.]